MRIAMRECVEASAEKNVLRDAISDGVGERVFGVAAARDEEGAECDGEGLVQLGCGLVNLGEIFRAEDGDGDGVVEDEGLRVVKLMRGAAHGYAESGAGWAGVLHS